MVINSSSDREKANGIYNKLKYDDEINLKFFKLQPSVEMKPTTEIYVSSKYLNKANRIQEIIGFGEIRKNKNLLDIVIILGEDLEDIEIEIENSEIDSSKIDTLGIF